MTSLARQLERLKVPGAHSRLGHDTRRTSLIFDAKEAANEDRLSVYHLGMTFYHWTLFLLFLLLVVTPVANCYMLHILMLTVAFSALTLLVGR